MSTPILSDSSVAKQSSAVEDDLSRRSKKKVKGGEYGFTGDESGPVCYADIAGGADAGTSKLLFRDKVLGVSPGDDRGSFDGDVNNMGTGQEEEFSDDGSLDTTGIEVVEKKHGVYDCPVLILTEKEEQRLQKPWKHGVIVKLLGRKIGFKALETRLRQMWVKRDAEALENEGGHDMGAGAPHDAGEDSGDGGGAPGQEECCATGWQR